MQGVTVGIRVDCHRGDAGLGAGADNTDGNFTAIGDQDFFNQAEFRRPVRRAF
jgi:hypothetical protein